jgi:cobyrinic acid a,c-diamide synthase
MSGKTIVSLALMYGLQRRGLRVAPFKVGPDYIDPTYHAAATGRPSGNLDVVLMGERGVAERFLKYSAGADIAVIEGVLGLYDSVDGVSELGSTAQVAKLLRAPVVLVLNGERVNRTLRAVVRGLKSFDPAVQISAVILTNVTERQAAKLAKFLPEEGVEVLGAVPKNSKIAEAFSYRHLGLTPVPERGDKTAVIDVIEKYVLPHIDLDRVMEVAKSAGDLPWADAPQPDPAEGGGYRIGIFFDRAFTFYYPEVFEAAKSLGSVQFIDSLSHSSLPDVDVLFIGGGFPEVFAADLSRNKPLFASLRRYVERGGRLYAECGGLMYLTSSIVIDGEEYEMAGLIDAVTVMLKRPVGKGYVWGKVVGRTPSAAGRRNKGTRVPLLQARAEGEGGRRHKAGAGSRHRRRPRRHSQRQHARPVHPHTPTHLQRPRRPLQTRRSIAPKRTTAHSTAARKT